MVKTVNGEKTTYFYGRDGRLEAETAGSQTIFYRYRNDGAPFSVQIDGIDYFYVVNPQGDIAGLLDAAGRLQARYTYDVWGRVVSIEGPNPSAYFNAGNIRK